MIDSTPSFSWPGGHRAAVGLLVHVPGFGFSQDGTSQADLVGLDYTPHGFARLLRVLADFDVSATFALTPEAAVDAPDAAAQVIDAGHEVAASFCSPSGSNDDLLRTLRDAIGGRVNGLVAQLPGFPGTELDRPWGSDSGQSWIINGSGGDLPTTQHDPEATVIPISPYVLDTTWLSPARPLPPSSLLEAWLEALNAHREDGTFMPIVIHPHIIGRPGFVSVLNRLLDDIIALGDVWIARMDHIAATWQIMVDDTKDR